MDFSIDVFDATLSSDLFLLTENSSIPASEQYKISKFSNLSNFILSLMFIDFGIGDNSVAKLRASHLMPKVMLCLPQNLHPLGCIWLQNLVQMKKKHLEKQHNCLTIPK